MEVHAPDEEKGDNPLTLIVDILQFVDAEDTQPFVLASSSPSPSAGGGGGAPSAGGGGGESSLDPSGPEAAARLHFQQLADDNNSTAADTVVLQYLGPDDASLSCCDIVSLRVAGGQTDNNDKAAAAGETAAAAAGQAAGAFKGDHDRSASVIVGLTGTQVARPRAGQGEGQPVLQLLGLVRLPRAKTDILLTMNVPLGPDDVDAGVAADASVSPGAVRLSQRSEVRLARAKDLLFLQMLPSMRICDWGLFGDEDDE